MHKIAKEIESFLVCLETIESVHKVCVRFDQSAVQYSLCCMSPAAMGLGEAPRGD